MYRPSIRFNVNYLVLFSALCFSEENLTENTETEKVTNLEEAHNMIRQLQGKLKAQSHQFLAWHRKFKIQVCMDKNHVLTIIKPLHTRS